MWSSWFFFLLKIEGMFAKALMALLCVLHKPFHAEGTGFYSVIFLHVPGYIQCILFMHQPKEVDNFPLKVFDLTE